MSLDLPTLQRLNCPVTSLNFGDEFARCRSRQLPFVALAVQIDSVVNRANGIFPNIFFSGHALPTVLETIPFTKIVAFSANPLEGDTTTSIAITPIGEIHHNDSLEQRNSQGNFIQMITNACIAPTTEVRLERQIDTLKKCITTNDTATNFWCKTLYRYFETTPPCNFTNYETLIEKCDELAMLCVNNASPIAIPLLEISTALKLNHLPYLITSDYFEQLEPLQPSSLLIKLLKLQYQKNNSSPAESSAKLYDEAEKLLQYGIGNSYIWHLMTQIDPAKTRAKAKGILAVDTSIIAVHNVYGSLLIYNAMGPEDIQEGYNHLLKAAYEAQDAHAYALLGLIDAHMIKFSFENTNHSQRNFDNIHRALQVDPNHFIANKALGLAYMQGLTALGIQKESGHLFLSRALQSNPQDVQILLELGVFFLEEGSSVEVRTTGREYIQLAFELEPLNPIAKALYERYLTVHL